MKYPAGGEDLSRINALLLEIQVGTLRAQLRRERRRRQALCLLLAGLALASLAGRWAL